MHEAVVVQLLPHRRPRRLLAAAARDERAIAIIEVLCQLFDHLRAIRRIDAQRGQPRRDFRPPCLQVLRHAPPPRCE
jgi:hypothetical protein